MLVDKSLNVEDAHLMRDINDVLSCHTVYYAPFL